MVRVAAVLLSGLALVVALMLGDVGAQEKKGKEETLKGTICCAKCELGKEKKCATVLVLKNKKNEDVIYYFDAEGDKKYHKEICTEAKKGEVVGVRSKDGEKRIITVKKVTFE